MRDCGTGGPSRSVERHADRRRQAGARRERRRALTRSAQSRRVIRHRAGRRRRAALATHRRVEETNPWAAGTVTRSENECFSLRSVARLEQRRWPWRSVYNPRRMSSPPAPSSDVSRSSLLSERAASATCMPRATPGSIAAWPSKRAARSSRAFRARGSRCSGTERQFARSPATPSGPNPTSCEAAARCCTRCSSTPPIATRSRSTWIRWFENSVVAWRRDLGRSVDYLETRADIDASKLGYIGYRSGGEPFFQQLGTPAARKRRRPRRRSHGHDARDAQRALERRARLAGQEPLR